MLRGPLAGLMSFAVLSFAAAKLTEEGSLPMEMASPVMLGALLLSAVIGGALSGGAGKRGLITGASLALIYFIGKLIFHSDSFFTSMTLLGAIVIVISAWLGSCIFHKKGGKYTKRNHKKQSKNYR